MEGYRGWALDRLENGSSTAMCLQFDSSNPLPNCASGVAVPSDEGSPAGEIKTNRGYISRAGCSAIATNEGMQGSTPWRGTKFLRSKLIW